VVESVKQQLGSAALAAGNHFAIVSLQTLGEVLLGKRRLRSEAPLIETATQILADPATYLRNQIRTNRLDLLGIDLPHDWQLPQRFVQELERVKTLLEQYKAEIERTAQPTPLAEKPAGYKARVLDHIDPDVLAERIRRGNEVKAAQRTHWQQRQPDHDSSHRGDGNGRS
jgi:hypothetical protein